MYITRYILIENIPVIWLVDLNFWWKYSISPIIRKRAKTSYPNVLLPSDVIIPRQWYVCDLDLVFFPIATCEPREQYVYHLNEIQRKWEIFVNDDDVRNILHSVYKTNIYCSFIQEMVKILPLGDWRPWAFYFLLFSLKLTASSHLRSIF